MRMLKKHGITVGLICIALLALFFAHQSRQEAGSVSSELERMTQVFAGRIADLDAIVDMQDRHIQSLKEDGFVETDGFPAYAERVAEATVIIVKDGEDIGSGFFIDQGGIVATASHVVDAVGDMFQVKTFDGQMLGAEILAKDSKTDISLVRVLGSNFPAVSLGYFENVEVGEEVGIAGFNRGLSRILVHRGVVSSKEDGGGIKQISINAFINKGNSGGPIFSAVTGRVIGMVSSRQADVPVEKLIALPAGYSSGFAIGGLDPVKFNVELYNETVKLVGDVSQVGIGFGVAIDHVRALQQKIIPSL